ncbi:MAG: hypothetical protein PUP91_36675 [Rhizonema sp. PD37]|nr:hypothetical protein [Rhizonema sp. PD37]
MVGKTISAYTDAKTASRVDAIAKLEHRPTSQIAGMALKFFVGLPLEARIILLQIEALASADDLEELNREITRTLLHFQHKIVHRQMIDQMNVDNLDRLETEDDILLAAVELTR